MSTNNLQVNKKLDLINENMIIIYFKKNYFHISEIY